MSLFTTQSTIASQKPHLLTGGYCAELALLLDGLKPQFRQHNRYAWYPQGQRATLAFFCPQNLRKANLETVSLAEIDKQLQ
jgi:hypothetical protein